MPATLTKKKARRHEGTEARSESKPGATMLPVRLLRLDGGTQPREGIDELMVDEYAERMKNGVEFPPVTVFYDGKHYWLSDGFHRVQALLQLHFATVAVDLRQGTQRDAILHSAGANAEHGIPRSNADKRRAVSMLLS